MAHGTGRPEGVSLRRRVSTWPTWPPRTQAPMAKNATIKAGDSEVCSQACTCGSCGRPGDRMNFFSLAIDARRVAV